MSSPLDFAVRVVVRGGGLVERKPDSVEAVLSPELGAALGLAELATLAETPHEGTSHVGYGSVLLERMVELAVAEVPFVAARAPVEPVRETLVRSAAGAMVFRNCIFSTGEVVAGTGTRLVAHATFSLEGDERREGICTAAVSLGTMGVVAGFEDAVGSWLEPAEGVAPSEDELRRAAAVAIAACTVRATEAAGAFRQGMERRLARDRERLEGYFDDLGAELDRRVARGRVSTSDAVEKRAALTHERGAKLEALSARYAIKLGVRPAAFLLVEAPVCRIALDLRRRKASRRIQVEYDSATRRIVPPVCESCGSPAPRPAVCDDAVHLACGACAPQAQGRIACRACRQ